MHYFSVFVDQSQNMKTNWKNSFYTRRQENSRNVPNSIKTRLICLWENKMLRWRQLDLVIITYWGLTSHRWVSSKGFIQGSYSGPAPMYAGNVVFIAIRTLKNLTWRNWLLAEAEVTKLLVREKKYFLRLSAVKTLSFNPPAIFMVPSYSGRQLYQYNEDDFWNQFCFKLCC